ncbi:MAG: hypothetical protein IT452_05290 [Planctomycetia bacterium]|nr:hypothetical protein [Planctomycetia bacterium]
MKKVLMLSLILAGAAAFAGCASSGYPSTEVRIEKVNKTIQAEQLTGQPSEARDKRFGEWTGVKDGPETAPKK